jgi:hypothetical protein
VSVYLKVAVVCNKFCYIHTMGPDAVVFCECVEKERLKSPHPFPASSTLLTVARKSIRVAEPKLNSTTPSFPTSVRLSCSSPHAALGGVPNAETTKKLALR